LHIWCWLGILKDLYCYHLMSWSNVWHLCVFVMSQVHISAWKLAIRTEVSVVLLGSSRQMLRYYLKLSYDCFLPYPFQFIIHQPSYHSTLYSLELLIMS
jgi:hypothetical protein